MAMMQKVKTFECCGITFSGRYPLQKHTKACHSNGFKCQICNRVFGNPSKFRLHKLMHSDSKIPFTCNHCGFITKKEYSFKIHTMSNRCKEAKIFECCEIRFRNSADIKKHVSAFHPDGLKCPTCKRVFQKPSVLRVHKLTHLNSKSTDVRDADLNYGQQESSDRKENSSTSPNDRNGKIKQAAGFTPVRIKDEPFSQSVGVQLHGRLTAEEVLSPSNDSSNKLLPLSDQPIKFIHEETRQIRSQTLLAMTVSNLMPLLKRLLTLSSSIIKRIREKKEIDTCSQIIETFEYVWNTYKMVIVRWKDLKGPMIQDASLTSIQNSYGTLPVFINWEKSEHLEILENAIVLSLNTVNNWQPPATSQLGMEVKLEPIEIDSADKPHQSFKPRIKTEETVQKNEEFELVSSGAAITDLKTKDLVSVPSKKVANKREVMEFCRLLNISITQNTKERVMSGFRDNSGDYHAMYRYGISKILNLYCPPGVIHLKCCKKVFNFSQLKTHVSQYHEAGNTGRTEPSISPP